MLQVRNTIMNATLAGMLVALLTFLQGGALASPLDSMSDVPDNGATQPQSAYQVEAKDDPAPWVLNTIRERYNVRLCREEIPKDRESDKITAKDMLHELTDLQKQRELSSSQINRLELVQELVDKGEGRVVVGWNDHKLEGEYKADTIPELMDQVLMDSPYGWYEENGTYVVIPWQGSRLQYLMSIDVENMLLSDVMTMVAEASPASASFTYRATGMGGTGNRDPKLIDFYREGIRNMTVPRLKMEGVPAIDVLNRAVEAAGGLVTWHLDGISNTLFYSPLPKQLKTWDAEFKATHGE